MRFFEGTSIKTNRKKENIFDKIQLEIRVKAHYG